MEQAGPASSFMFKGVVSKIMQKLSTLPLEDVFIEEPTLEEIFLHYYR
jgi:ABC-2 type transport system ATP-binding protein